MSFQGPILIACSAGVNPGSLGRKRDQGKETSPSPSPPSRSSSTCSNWTRWRSCLSSWRTIPVNSTLPSPPWPVRLMKKTRRPVLRLLLPDHPERALPSFVLRLTSCEAILDFLLGRHRLRSGAMWAKDGCRCLYWYVWVAEFEPRKPRGNGRTGGGTSSTGVANPLPHSAERGILNRLQFRRRYPRFERRSWSRDHQRRSRGREPARAVRPRRHRWSRGLLRVRDGSAFQCGMKTSSKRCR